MLGRTWSSKALIIVAILVVGRGWRFSLIRDKTGTEDRTDAGSKFLLDFEDDGKTSSSNNVELSQIFDCEAEGAICTYFELGRFLKSIPDQMIFDSLGGSNRNLPALSSFTTTKISSDNEFSSLPSEFTFVHVHKCGGTSLKSALVGLAKQLGGKVSPYKYSYGGGSSKQKEANRVKREEHIARLERLDLPVFAVVRDPVERFLSAVQQVMHYNEELRDKCLSSSAKKTILCSINDAKERKFRGDVHLLPMVAHFRLLESTRVSVFPMEVLPLLLSRYFGVGEHHVRDRSDENYATSKVLSKMSVTDCTKQMVGEICKLYEVDVAFLESIGLPSKHCHP